MCTEFSNTKMTNINFIKVVRNDSWETITRYREAILLKSADAAKNKGLSLSNEEQEEEGMWEVGKRVTVVVFKLQHESGLVKMKIAEP